MAYRSPLERAAAATGSPYGMLLLALTVMLLVYPFLSSHQAVRWVFDLITLGIVATALRATYGRRLVYSLTWVLGLSAFITGVLSRSLDIASAYPFAAGLRVLFLGYLIVVIFGDIMRRRTVTMDAVMAASCVYVLLGFTFGSAYVLLEWLVPGSFNILAVPQSLENVYGQTAIEFKLAYFSLVTMTTIGFGDIVPLAAPARSMAALEELIAQLYLAIIIARLVGLEMTSRLQNPDSGSE